jgi:hypothetical protein
MWCLPCALAARVCVVHYPFWHVPLLAGLHCVLSSYPTHASGSLLILQRVSDRLASRHVVLALCPCCPRVCCSLPMLECGHLTSPHCVPSCYPTHASGSLLILQRVSDLLASRHMMLAVCPCCPCVCCSLPMLACGHLTSPHCVSFVLPHTCVWIPPDSAAGE